MSDGRDVPFPFANDGRPLREQGESITSYTKRLHQFRGTQPETNPSYEELFRVRQQATRVGKDLAAAKYERRLAKANARIRDLEVILTSRAVLAVTFKVATKWFGLRTGRGNRAFARDNLAKAVVVTVVSEVAARGIVKVLHQDV